MYDAPLRGNEKVLSAQAVSEMWFSTATPTGNQCYHCLYWMLCRGCQHWKYLAFTRLCADTEIENLPFTVCIARSGRVRHVVSQPDLLTLRPHRAGKRVTARPVAAGLSFFAKKGTTANGVKGHGMAGRKGGNFVKGITATKRATTSWPPWNSSPELSSLSRYFDIFQTKVDIVDIYFIIVSGR